MNALVRRHRLIHKVFLMRVANKIHLAVVSYGLPIEFILTGGDVNDCTAATELIEQLPTAEAIIEERLRQ